MRLGSTQLESIVQLPATGHDWVLVPRAQRLLVSLRDAGSVAVIDTLTRKLVASVPTGEGSLPTRLVVDPDGRRVWVGLDGRAEVVAIDVLRSHITGRASVGRGVHTLVAPPQNGWLFVTNGTSNSVTLVDRATLQSVADLPVGATPVASAWSAAAARLAVLSANTGTLHLIDAEQRTQSTVALARGALVLGLFDEGRHALVANGATATLSLVDLASGRKVAEREVPARPDQIAFSREFAYVRSQSTAEVQVIALAQARQGQLGGVSVPMGRRAPEEEPDAINVASVLAPPPEGNGMLVANAGDGSIYRYAQGMMVPVNSHSNYRRRARALMVLDGSLSERTPGHFEAAARFDRGGRYDVVVRNLRPAVTACFTIDVEGAAVAAESPTAVPRPSLVTTRRLDDRTLEVDFMLLQPPNAAAADVDVLLVQRSGTWQGRARAKPLDAGLWRARVYGVPTGRFEAMVAASEWSLSFANGRLGELRWPLTGPALP